MRKSLKRAGLDYWDKLDVTVYCDFQDFLNKNPGAKIYMATTKAPKVYTEVSYEPDCFLMFGKESAGIPEEILLEHQETCVRIPMWGDIRSLNLSNSVAIVLYEALRQNGFDQMTLEGSSDRNTSAKLRREAVSVYLGELQGEGDLCISLRLL